MPTVEQYDRWISKAAEELDEKRADCDVFPRVAQSLAALVQAKHIEYPPVGKRCVTCGHYETTGCPGSCQPSIGKDETYTDWIPKP